MYICIKHLLQSHEYANSVDILAQMEMQIETIMVYHNIAAKKLICNVASEM